jgi:hypothetical protein
LNLLFSLADKHIIETQYFGIMHKTICFFGQMASGKTISAEYFCQKINELNNSTKWKCNGFASSVKKIFSECFQVDLEFIETWKRISQLPYGFLKNVRDSLIYIGDGFRQIKSDVWIDLLFRNNSDANLAIADGRYLQEARAVRKREGLNVLLYRPGFENDIQNDSEQQVVPYIKTLLSMQPVPEGRIPQEFPDIPFDFFVINNGTIADLFRKIDKYILPEFLKENK